VLELLREAEALAERLNDDGRRGQVFAFMANIHSRLDQPTEALVSGTRAVEIATRRGDLGLRILATTYLEQAHYYRGEYARVIELATENLAALPPEWALEFFGGNQPPSVHDRYRLVASLAQLGRFAEAAGHEAEAIRLAERTGHAYTLGIAYYGAGTLALAQGDWTKARAMTDRQIEALRTGNVVGELPSALAHSARALAHLGDAGQALDRCREAERLLAGRTAAGRGGHGGIDAALGRAYLLIGRLDDAERLGARAVDSASERVDFIPDALWLLGDLATHPDRFDAERGPARYGEALALAEPRGMRPLVAHCHLGLGRLFRRTGGGDRARGHLSTAAAMYRAMDLRAWQDEAERALRELG
jgi:tetratricopeptide (TPR) repeat protein